MGKKFVLIVDDDVTLRELLKVMLDGEYTVFEASDGMEAINAYRSFKPDVVLMDVMMPKMNGVEATKEIKKIDPGAKIIAVTAFAASKGKEMLEAGALDILEKPFTRRKLIELIEKHISIS
jgi:CheY-like chemotaxis protein